MALHVFIFKVTYEWYKNGQRRYEGYWKNGKQDGLECDWYENGQIWFETHWKNGEKDGMRRWWHGPFVA